MKVVSKSTGLMVMLTLTAVFLAAISLTTVWYHVGTAEYAIDYYSRDGYNWFEYWRTGHDDPGDFGAVMVGQEFIAVIWYLTAIIFVGLCLVESRRLSLVAGLILIIVSAGLVLHFVLWFPDAVGVPGFFGTEYGPDSGFAVALAASVVQISAVLIRVHDVSVQKRMRIRPIPVISLDEYEEKAN
ncbi:MAG TPA: hypothetical protein VMW71_02000 [Thermoplasmata archaeon]|nr:hypothetical protein [Thermoplasmata archaeon]